LPGVGEDVLKMGQARGAWARDTGPEPFQPGSLQGNG